MPKLPPISGKKLIHVLMHLGFETKRQSGSHVILEHADGRITVVPVHGNKGMPPGTLKAILKDCEITSNDFMELL